MEKRETAAEYLTRMAHPLRRIEACAADDERVVEEYPDVVAHRLVRDCGCVIIRVTRPRFAAGAADGDPAWKILIENFFPCEACIRAGREVE